MTETLKERIDKLITPEVYEKVLIKHLFHNGRELTTKQTEQLDKDQDSVTVKVDKDWLRRSTVVCTSK